MRLGVDHGYEITKVVQIENRNKDAQARYEDRLQQDDAKVSLTIHTDGPDIGNCIGAEIFSSILIKSEGKHPGTNKHVRTPSTLRN